MPQADNAALVLVDIQGKLATLMHEREALYRNLQILIRGARALDLPILWLEQYPQGLGPTIPEVAALLPELQPLPKVCFSGAALPAFDHTLQRTHRRQVLLAGIETHICVFQTGRDLLCQGYQVEVVADAVSSRTPANRETGLQRLVQEGARLTSVEMCLFDMLQAAGSPAFKEIARLVK